VGEERRRLLGIEGARALAASSILVYHVWSYGAGGVEDGPADLGFADKPIDNLRAGVTLFFVLSGFLLYRPFAAAVIRRRPVPSIRRYLTNRALRILPAYWTILLLVALLLERELLTRPLQLVANLLLVHSYVPEYHVVNGHEGVGIGPSWSLVVEVAFYLTLPILAGLAAWLAFRRRRRPVSAVLAPIALLALVGVGAKIAYRLAPELGRTWDQMGFPTHADWFGAGMLLAVSHVLWEDGRLRLPPRWRIGALAGAVALALVSAKLWYSGTLLWTEYQAFVAVACALLLALVVFAPPGSRVLAVLEWRPVVAVGVASYSVFLWNDPIVRSLRDAGLTIEGPVGFAVNVVVVATVVGIVSAVTYRLVEKPALSLKRRSTTGIEASTDAEPIGSAERGDLRPTPRRAGSRGRAAEIGY
jgi:peptidoglycan/LPS O-acetylase OafA/YrhL